MRGLLRVLILLLFAAVPVSSQVTAYRNGFWFDGQSFRSETFYVAQNVLFTHPPRGKMQVTDLHGGYVIPPLADAHNHFPGGQRTFDLTLRANVEAGIFYVLNPNDIAEETEPLRLKLNQPQSIDVIFAHGGFTRPGGHPEALYKNLARQKYVSFSENDLEGHAFWAVDAIEDIERKWLKFLSTRPDIVKLYLLDSAAYSRNQPGRVSEGLRPEIFRELVRRAHKAGLRAGAHVETAADFAIAAESGTDLILHLPGYYKSDEIPEEEYRLDDTVVQLARRNQVSVVTTAKLLEPASGQPIDASMRAIQIANLKRLKAAGVPILIGSDGFAGKGTVAEAAYLHDLGVFTPAELLRAWTEATPRAIFPNRLIGRLASGYEASFLVIERNPLDDWTALSNIRMRVKQGQVLAGAD